MSRIPKSADELELELVEQICALRASIAAYDSGSLWEAKRLAASIYMLCFDGTGRTKSLLGMLGRKSTMKFISSWTDMSVEGVQPIIVVPPTSLLFMYADDEFSGFKPYCMRKDFSGDIKAYSDLVFSRWWDEVLFHPTSKITLSRKNIIFNVRTKDGGGHVDDHLTDMDYRILRTIGDGRIRFGPSNKPLSHPGNIVWPIVRQIAWELEYSLHRVGL